MPSFAELGFLLLMSMYVMRYSLNDSSVSILHKLAQGSTSLSSAANARSYLSQYITELQLPVQGTAAEYWQQKLIANPQCAAVPLVAQDVISAPASQAFVERLFSVCGLLTKGTRNRMEKSLYMRAWLKVNFDELNDML